MPSNEARERNQPFAWDGPTWKASLAVFLTIFAGSGPALVAQASLDPVPTWVVVVVVVAITTGLGLAAWAVGEVLEESSLVTLVLVGGTVLLLAGRLWAGHETDALRPGDGILRAWAAMSVFAAGLAITVGWFIAVLRTPGLRRRAVAVLVTGAAVVSGVAAALTVAGA